MTAGITELMSGNIFMAMYLFWNSLTFGWFIPICLFTIQLLVYLQTDDSSTMLTIGLMFCVLFGLAGYTNIMTMRIMLIALGIEGAVLIYNWFK